MKKRLEGTYGGDAVRTVDRVMFIFVNGATTKWERIPTVVKAVQDNVTLDMGDGVVLTHPAKDVVRLSKGQSIEAFSADKLISFLKAL